MRVVIERYKKLDVLVNNAGVALAKDVEHTTLEEWRWLMSINLDGVFLGTRYAIQTMKANGSGSIVNLSSIEGLVGDPNLAAYNASKGGVRLLTKSAALHCAKSGYNIRVNSVHPGYIWSQWWRTFSKLKAISRKVASCWTVYTQSVMSENPMTLPTVSCTSHQTRQSSSPERSW